ncbi:pneumococcal serine-rich repeat protein isoform X2 [Anopheles gambiae]|uniref:pneumococcal serine-rich repeat protein isoform X2 n=1 Tax=Anopheles gambiae TaxID=7165 RepID=UPI002AC93908|nr:pneumococcal serine-rich repeat protein isoform X2 [Anopheles gambiae]
MSTLTNNANNSSSNSNSNNNNNSSSNNTNNNNNSIASYYQQYIQHYQLSPQGGTAPPSAGGSPTVTSINNNNNNNNGPTSDNIHTINNNNNNISTSSSSTSSNQSQPTTAANSGSGGGGGVVGGILGVREVSAKLFLPFARAKMMHSSSSAASTPAKDQHQPGTPLDGTSMAGMNATPSGTPSATPGTTTGGSSAGVSGAGRASSLIIPKALNVVLHGYHRKHKTNKKKYFVVYGDVPGKAARLEYFDSEKKFKQSFQKGSAGCDGGTQPKRTIVLRTCFNINKRHDLKKQIISLYTKDDSFCIVFESEEELNLWLRTLLRLQRGEDSEGDPPRPTFEHVWEVYVQRKGLGDSYGILGNYRLCITDKTLSLVRIGSELTPHQEKRAENVEFLLASVRRCGHSQRYFYLEVGRSSKTGAGEIWMEVQDSIIAQNMYTTIMKSAKSKDDNLGPMIRIRSSSANAASKPTSMLFRRQTHTGQKPINCSPSSVTSASATAGVVFHQRALSLPSAPMLGHSPHSNTHHLGALHAHSGGSGSSVRSSSQCSVVAAVAAGTQGGLLPSATGGSQHIVTLSTSLSSSSASCAGTGTIQPVHHRTRSLPLTEESAIRLTAEHYRQGGGGWWQPHHHAPSSLSHYNHLQQPHCSSAAGASNHRKSSSAYLPAPPPPAFASIGCSSAQCPMHAGGPNGGGGWSPPVSDVLCTSPPHRHQYELSPEGPQPFASLVPSRSSMESIIEDQRYLPMDLKKPAGEETPEPPLPPALPAGSQLTLISRLLRSSNLQQHASTSSAGSGSGSASSPGTTLSAGKIGLLGLKMAMMAEGRGSASSNGGCCSCSSPSQSQCSIGSNCLQAISSNSTTNTTTITTTTSSSHKSTNGSSPAALRRLSAGRTASGTISRSVAIARERCDSLPSRNRTTSETMPHQQQQQQQHLLNQQQQQQHHHQLMLNSGSMPPPRMIPSSNRPHSVHISHSHSPPVNSSPLSPPPPATYSTGSDGSSLSIDESTDSFITGSLTPDEGQGYPKVINQLNSGCSIPEENSEEFIKDYGHIDLSAAGCGISQHDDFAVPTHHTAAPTSNATPILAGSSSSSAVGRVGHPHHNSLSLPISQAARRGGSPAPPSTVGSVEGSAYMEMCSPSGSSPGDPSGSCYMAMSPVADFSRGLCSSSSAHSRASSLAEDIVDGYVPMSMPRTAAAAPAAPPTEEYMLMDPTLNGGGTSSRLSNATAASNNAGSSIIGGGGMSSAASSCSITSGTPSADLRLSLEKVPAYIGQSDEHEVNDRPFRTYSVGSRPELIKRKLRVEMLSSGESSVGGSSAGGSASSRQRAFSVGSRAKVPRCSDVYKGYSAAPVIVSFASTSSQGSMLESSNNNSSSSTSSISHAGSYGASIGDTLPMDELAGGGSAGGSSMGRKSGSGSLLPDGAGGGKPPSHGGSHGRMSDLMEIDYSSPRQQPARPSTRSSEPSGMEDYLDMSGNNNEEEQRARGQGATSSGYVEMRPGRLNSQSEENDYLNMTPGGGGRDEPDCCPAAASIATSSPIQIQHHAKQPADGAGSAHSSSSNNNNNNYLEMYPRAAVAQKEQKRTASAASTTTTATKVPSEDYLNMAPLMISSLGEASGSEEEKMHGPDEEPLLESSSAPPDGYMEMSWNHHGPVTAAGPVSSSASSSATSSARTVPTNGGDDYMNMSCGSGSQSEDASRTYSAPITIQPGAGKCRLDLSGESKVEAGANIPNYLPLGQHPDARKSVHHPHHQSAMIVALQQHLPLAAQAPIQTTTGQQSGSIGFSPSKPAETTPERARCDSRDSGIVTPSGSQPTIFPFSPASPTKPFAPAQDEPMGGESLDDLSQNYAELSLGRQQQQQLQQAQTELSPAIRKLSTGSNRGSGSFSKLQLVANQPDYVNYCPATPPISGDVAPPASIMPLNVLPSAQSRTRSSIDDDGAGDYALMNPASSRKLSTTSMGSMGGASLSPAGVVPPGSSAVGSITPPVLVARKSTLLLSSPQMGFKPIASSQDAELLLQSKAVPHATANSPKALNLGRRTGEPAFSFTEQQHQQQQMAPLQRSISTGTRPNSVNSELIGRPIGTPAGPSTPGAASHSSTTAAGSTRPSSANSERLPVISATSSSASSTSTLCESKNQSPSASSTALAMVVGSSTTTSPPSVPGSRPDSVSSITDPHIVSRPPSVSSERELHYASLDLPPCSSSSSGKQTVAASPFAPGTMMLLAAAAAATTPAATSSAAAPVTKMDVDEPLPGSNEARTSIDSSSPSPTTAAGLQQQQQPVRCAAFTYAQIDFVRSQAQSQQGQTGTGPAGASGQSTTTTTTSTPPQSSQA